MSDEQQYFSVPEAAVYLGFGHTESFKHHIYEKKDIRPDATIGGRLMFTRETLDAWDAKAKAGGIRRTAGRPAGGALKERLTRLVAERFPAGMPQTPPGKISGAAWNVARDLIGGKSYAEIGEAMGFSRARANELAKLAANHLQRMEKPDGG
jgi:hypothetical protein